MIGTGYCCTRSRGDSTPSHQLAAAISLPTGSPPLPPARAPFSATPHPPFLESFRLESQELYALFRRSPPATVITRPGLTRMPRAGPARHPSGAFLVLPAARDRPPVGDNPAF